MLQNKICIYGNKIFSFFLSDICLVNLISKSWKYKCLESLCQLHLKLIIQFLFSMCIIIVRIFKPF